MNDYDALGNPLTEQDAQTCLRIVRDSCPKVMAQLKRMRDAGLPAPQAEEQCEANRQIAEGILRLYFPDRLM